MPGPPLDSRLPWADFDRPRASARARLLFPVVLCLFVQVPAALFLVLVFRGDGALPTLLLAVAGPLALLGARRYPGPTVALVAALAAVDFAIGSGLPSPPYLALAFAIGGAIIRGARVWAWVSVGVAWAATLVFGILAGIQWHPGRIAGTTFAILLVFGLAEGIRTRREHAHEFREAMMRRRQSEVRAERTRIARELHDVLAHSLSQINVQAGVGLHLMDAQPDKAKDALASIKETSKSALDEVRSLLGVLRAEGATDPDAPLVPEPDLSRLPGLVASVSTQGVEVTLRDGLGSAPPKAVQLAVYRIVQESLTNVVRHSGAQHATVDVRADGDDVVVEVADDGSGIAGEPGGGLLGMRERAELLGGTLMTGTSTAGGTVVTARIPLKEHP
jgi:signal transduction histidine kinase